jgi:hypothetical protein
MRKKSSILYGLLAAAMLLGVSGCARETRLTQITLQPGAETFLNPNPNLQVHFTALGTFIHPPATRDISAEVTWKTDTPQLISVAGGIVSPTGAGCGVATVTATSNKDTGGSKNILVGNASVTVNDPSNPDCPGGSTPSVTLTLLLTGNGTVVSSPAGINCPGTCAASFPANTSITLTPTAGTGASFGGWQNCPVTSGNSCIVTLTANESVTATFN